jgi:hypothetical protein
MNHQHRAGLRRFKENDVMQVVILLQRGVKAGLGFSLSSVAVKQTPIKKAQC